MQTPDTDSSEYAALIEFAATSGRSRAHPAVASKADALIAQFCATRVRAMTEAIVAVAKAATQPATR